MNDTGEPEYLRRLNPEQRQAVEHSGSPLLILAGAGSGKTRVITTKIAYLIDRGGLDPRSILAVTFTNKAAQEMKERVVALVPHADDVMVRTFHSFGAWFLRRNAALAGLSPRFLIYDEEDCVSLLKTIAGKDEDRGFLRRIWEEISRVKDIGLAPEEAAERIARAGCAPEVFTRYEERLRATGNVDFGDLILLPIRLLRDNPEVRERTRQRFTVILVDEYQDSNMAQFHLLRELVGPKTYLCVVGDDDQSIYRFRGAEVGNILSFPKVFEGTQVVRLERNYRSTQAILDAATSVVSHNAGRLGKTLWTERSGGEIPTVACLQDQDEEARYCAGLIQDGFSGTTAILYRMNAQSRHFEDRFRVEGIPYRLIGTVRFYSRQEVKDALAYLSLLVNPRDEVGFRRIANTPSRGLGPASVQKIVDLWRPGESLEDACRRVSLPPRARLGARELLGCLQECSARLEELPLSELARLLLTRSGLYEHYRHRDRSDGTSKSANLEEMVSAMAPYGAGQEALGAFLESVALANPADEAEQSGEEPKVTLITLHNTKGLEFDRVIISGLEEGIFPHDSSQLSAEDLEEERRLFYVGITRARERLTMTWCLRRRIFGRTTETAPSRFLDEIPKEQLNHVESEAAAFLLGRGAGPQADAYPPGAGVFHDEYGPGVVERTWYTDGSLLVQVRFQSGRVAKFLPKYARLERIGFDE